MMLLSGHHLLAALPSSITGQIPGQYDSPTGDWVAISLRVSALAYNPRSSAAQLPASILDLAKPQWKGKVAFSPTDSDFVPLVGAVIAAYGQQAALDWLRGLKANGTTYADIESAAAAVNRGQAAAGIINQYYWYRLQLELGTGTHSKLYFFPNRDVGGIENISGAAVVASSSHKDAAQKFVSFLVSAQAERILAAGDTFEYPVRPGIAANNVLAPLPQVNPAVIQARSTLLGGCLLVCLSLMRTTVPSRTCTTRRSRQRSSASCGRSSLRARRRRSHWCWSCFRSWSWAAREPSGSAAACSAQARWPSARRRRSRWAASGCRPSAQ